MGNEHPNLQVMKSALEAFSKGDGAALARLFSPDIVWHVPGKGPLSKSYSGQAEVFGFFGKLMELTGGTFRVESVEMLANDRGGVFIDRIKAQRNGKSLDVLLLLKVVIRDG